MYLFTSFAAKNTQLIATYFNCHSLFCLALTPFQFHGALTVQFIELTRIFKKSVSRAFAV